MLSLPAALARPAGKKQSEQAARCRGEMVSPRDTAATVKERAGNMKNFIGRFVREDEGQDLVEYALLIAFIALACIIGLQQLGTAINNTYNSISASLTGALS
jgi:pilus assembly protein Flp/PilA